MMNFKSSCSISLALKHQCASDHLVVSLKPRELSPNSLRSVGLDVTKNLYFQQDLTQC
jgi:hypothetical protein